MNDLSSITTQSMSSLEIAELTGKQHSDVLRDIRKMVQSLDNAKMLYQQYQVVTCPQTKRTKSINLNKDLSLTLVSGYNVKLRYKIVQRWQQLESTQQPKLPTNFVEALKLLVVSEETKARLLLENEKKAKQLEVAKPKIELHDRLVSENTSISIGEFANLLHKTSKVKIGPNKLFAYLRSTAYLKMGRDPSERNMPYQKWIDAGYFVVNPTEINGRIRSQTMITVKGQKVLGDSIVAYFATENNKQTEMA